MVPGLSISQDYMGGDLNSKARHDPDYTIDYHL